MRLYRRRTTIAAIREPPVSVRRRADARSRVRVHAETTVDPDPHHRRHASPSDTGGTARLRVSGSGPAGGLVALDVSHVTSLARQWPAAARAVRYVPGGLPPGVVTTVSIRLSRERLALLHRIGTILVSVRVRSDERSSRSGSTFILHVVCDRPGDRPEVSELVRLRRDSARSTTGTPTCTRSPSTATNRGARPERARATSIRPGRPTAAAAPLLRHATATTVAPAVFMPRR